MCFCSFSNFYVAIRRSYALVEINKLRDVKAAVASRTDQPDWAAFCMEHLVAGDDTTLSKCFGNLVEISYNDKTHHFKNLHNKTGIPFENMVFFDNEHWNIQSVSKLGVKCIYTPDGMQKKHWDEAKEAFGL
jgi:magnesium-dependent phosphatase 1